MVSSLIETFFASSLLAFRTLLRAEVFVDLQEELASLPANKRENLIKKSADTRV